MSRYPVLLIIVGTPVPAGPASAVPRGVPFWFRPVPLMSIMSPRRGRSPLIYNRVTGLAARAAIVRGQFGTDGRLWGEADIEKSR